MQLLGCSEQLLGCSWKLLGSCYADARVFWDVSGQLLCSY